MPSDAFSISDHHKMYQKQMSTDAGSLVHEYYIMEADLASLTAKQRRYGSSRDWRPHGMRRQPRLIGY